MSVSHPYFSKIISNQFWILSQPWDKKRTKIHIIWSSNLYISFTVKFYFFYKINSNNWHTIFACTDFHTVVIDNRRDSHYLVTHICLIQKWGKALKHYHIIFSFLDKHTLQRRFIWLIVVEDCIHGELVPSRCIMVEARKGSSGTVPESRD